MKKNILIAMLLVAVNAWSQETTENSSVILRSVLDPISQKYITEGVVMVDSLSRELLMEGAYNWLYNIKYAKTLASKGIVMDQAVFHKIIVNQYYITSYKLGDLKVRFVLTLQFKDGRFKYTYTDFVYYASGGKNYFEHITNTGTRDQHLLLRNFLIETESYINTSMDELTAYLRQYRADESW